MNNYSKISVYECYKLASNMKYDDYKKLTEEQKANIKIKLEKYMTSLINDYNKSFNYVNHENLKNSYMSLKEEHKLIALREKQFLNSEKLFWKLYNLYKHYRVYVKDKNTLKELFNTLYNISIKQSILTTELYEDYYFKLNKIYFDEEIPYNYKTTAEFFLKLTEYNNGLPIYVILSDYENYKTQHNIDFEPKQIDISLHIDLEKTEKTQKENLDFYQDNNSYFIAHEILQLTDEYKKLPNKLKTLYKKLAIKHDTKPLYEKNYFLNNLLNKKYFLLTEKNKSKEHYTNRINKLYDLNSDFLNAWLIYEQDPSIYETKPRKKLYF